MEPNPREPPTRPSVPVAGVSLLRYLWQCGILETIVTATFCSTVMMSFAPITATSSFRVWHQLPDAFLLPRPGDVGLALYWTLCLLWGGAIGIFAAIVESVVLLATRAILPAKPVHMTIHALLAMTAFFLGACCHGGLAR
jgi:hypothetical protein